MSSVNKVILVGNVGQDPEIRAVGDKTVANFSVATSERWKSNGEQREKTQWHRIVAWERNAKVAEDYIRKGTKVYIEGKIETRKWTDQSGADKFTTEIILDQYNGKIVVLKDGIERGERGDDRGGGGYSGGGYGAGGYGGGGGGAGGRGGSGGGGHDDLDDDIPF